MVSWAAPCFHSIPALYGFTSVSSLHEHSTQTWGRLEPRKNPTYRSALRRRAEHLPALMAVEEITEAVRALKVEDGEAAAAPAAGEGPRRANNNSNRIQVSNTKKPLFFYVNLAKVPYPAASSPFSPCRSTRWSIPPVLVGRCF